MTPLDFQYLSQLVHERSGLVLADDKAYLLESRLMPIARKLGLKGLEDLVQEARSGNNDSLAQEIMEAMTTNESFFFRDIKPFDTFREVTLPQLLESRAHKKAVRIWCAAASSGQEPYSLAMLLKEEDAKLSGWRFDIVGTDISTEILTKAEAGTYSQFEVQRGLSMQMLVKYFDKTGESWTIKESVRSMVQFKQVNLLGDFGMLGQFDVVFCRNVLIYFDQPTKTDVLEKVSNIMPADGVLYLGGAETVLGISDKFEPMPNRRGVYGLARAEIKESPSKPVAQAPPSAGQQAP